MTHDLECKSPDCCGAGTKPSLNDLLDRCRTGGLRKTYLLRNLLEQMIAMDRPVNVQQLMNLEGIAGACNPATCYRLLNRLEESGIIRRIGTHARSIHYILNLPGRHRDYLICAQCGKVEIIHLACPVRQMETEVQETSGYSGVYHELHFFGKCPDCE